MIAAAQEMLQETSALKKEPAKKEAKPKSEKPAKKKAEPEVKKPKTTTASKKKTEAKVEKRKTEAKAKAAEVKAKKPAKKKAKAKEAKPKKKAAKEKAEIPVRVKNIDQKLLRIAQNKKKRMPNFHADQAHRWKRVKNRWRKLRGIDSYARQKKKGRIAMVSPGYRTPRSMRYLHPSLYVEVPVHRPADLEGLDADIHAVRIAATVGARKRQEILSVAEMKTLRVLNPGTIEEIAEEDLFTDLDLEED